MDQEDNFLKYYESLTPEEIEDEIMTLNNIRLSVDFWEYIATDPEKLLAIIHYNQLEEKYGIKIVFDNKRKSATIDPDDLCKDCSNCQELTDATGNMTIIFRFNNDIYHISTMIDSVSNTNIYESFVEQILFLLNNHRSEVISREEKYLAGIEKTIKERYNTSVNLLWYIMNSPMNIKEIINKIDREMSPEPIEQTPSPSPVPVPLTVKEAEPEPEAETEVEETIEVKEKKTDICPILTIMYCLTCYMIIKYLEFVH